MLICRDKKPCSDTFFLIKKEQNRQSITRSAVGSVAVIILYMKA